MAGESIQAHGAQNGRIRALQLSCRAALPEKFRFSKTGDKGEYFCGLTLTGHGEHPRAIVLLRARSLSAVCELIGLGLTKSRCNWSCPRMDSDPQFFLERGRRDRGIGIDYSTRQTLSWRTGARGNAPVK